MIFSKYLYRLRLLRQVIFGLLRNPRECLHHQVRLSEFLRGAALADQFLDTSGVVAGGLSSPTVPEPAPNNPLWKYFSAHTEGPGIWKWVHYFDIYNHYLRKYVGSSGIHLLEIGVYSGGSLAMWRDYLGPGSRISGVDIDAACKLYESDRVSIFVGDQADRDFWAGFREKSPPVDIVIDDGGHDPEQQMVSLEELLPYLRPGGVYICEDVTGERNRFADFVRNFADRLNSFTAMMDEHGQLSSRSTGFQNAVKAVHLYPFVVVVEMNERPIHRFVCPKHGTEWQPRFAEWAPSPARHEINQS